MSIELNDITTKKLVLTQRLYQEAYSHSLHQNNPTSRLISVVIFDLANETMLKAAASAIKSFRRSRENDQDKEKVPNDFSGVIQSARICWNKQGLGVLPDEAQIEYVHGLRNDAQHKTSYPDHEQVSTCRAYTKAFLDNITTQLWGEVFGKIGMLDLVEDTYIKEMLEHCEHELKENAYGASIGWASIAFDNAFSKAAERTVGKLPTDLLVEAKSANIPNFFARMSHLLVMQIAGIPISKVHQFDVARSGVAYGHLGGDKLATAITGPMPTHAKAEDSFILATEIILQIESFIKNFQPPQL